MRTQYKVYVDGGFGPSYAGSFHAQSEDSNARFMSDRELTGWAKMWARQNGDGTTRVLFVAGYFIAEIRL